MSWILNKGRKPKKEVLLEELAKEDLQVLSLAYVYAKNLQMYGIDITKAICSATENMEIISRAHQQGYYDAMNRIKSESKNNMGLWGLCRYDLSKKCEGKYKDCVDCVLDEMKAEFINQYPKNYTGEPELNGTSCVFSLNKVLDVIDNYKTESGDKK